MWVFLRGNVTRCIVMIRNKGVRTWCGIEDTLMFAYIGKYNWLVVI